MRPTRRCFLGLLQTRQTLNLGRIMARLLVAITLRLLLGLVDRPAQVARQRRTELRHCGWHGNLE